MKRLRRVVSGGAAIAAAVAVVAMTCPPARGAATTVISPTTTKIQHVVVIYEENHTFDEMFGSLCATRTPACNGLVGPVRFADGKVATNVAEPDLIPYVRHQGLEQQLALANRWDEIDGCTDPPYVCVTHVTPDQIPNLAALATRFTVSDATYADSPTASWTAHLELAAGRELGFTSGDIPVPSVTGAAPAPGWGCESSKDILWRTGAYVPTCVPDRHGRGPYRPSPVPYTPTVMQKLEAAGLSWHIYQGDDTAKLGSQIWAFCTYFFWCLNKRFDAAHDSVVQTFDDAAAGRLPDVSFVLPTWSVSQHNQSSLAEGDNFIGRVVSAVENGPNWASTAIFITYDDCGCFYDHMTPPPGMGFRNPTVIVSPWAVAGGVDSTTADQPYSVLAFIKHNFGLPSVSWNVDNAYDYANAFDFSQSPTAAVAMTSTSIPRRERRRLHRLAQLPRNREDPS